MLQTWFERVRNVPILDVLSFLGYNHYARNGKSKIRSKCILSQHLGPNKTGTSFSIDINQNIWYCHGCRAGGGNIELVKHDKGYDTIAAANLIAQHACLETYEEVNASTPEEREAYKNKIMEQDLVYKILTIAAHHFHSLLTLELRHSLLVPQGNIDPKDTWKNLYQTWGLTDESIEESLIGYDDGYSLLKLLREKEYSDSDILKTGLYYLDKDGNIGNSVFKNRLIFPYQETGRIINFIARATSKTWPCYKDDPSKELKENNSFRYAKYKKLPLYDESDRTYISKIIQSQFFGLDELRRKKNGVIVEGITDVILMRMFFSEMQKAGIKEASQWAVGSFLSNQISNSHIEQLAKAAKNMDNLLFLCDNEDTQRGNQGAFTTARKLLERGIQALIGSLPLEKGQEKVDPVEWIKEASPQWEDFQSIIQQAKNIVEISLEQATEKIESIGKNVSKTNKVKIKRQEVEKVLDLVMALPEIEREEYIVAFTEPPFAYKSTVIKNIIKSRQEELSLMSQSQDRKPIESNSEFSLPGILPEGWDINSDGLYKEIIGRNQSIQYLRIAKAPMIITERYYDIDTGQYYLKSEFFERNLWKSRTESREVFMSSRLLPGLAKWGFPTSTENSKELVKFLMDYEAANSETIKVSQVVSSCGNKEINGKKAFVLGKQCIYKDKKESIEFFTPDIGDLQIVNAFEEYGNLETWREMVKKCVPYSGVMLALYTTLSGPFLQHLKSKGFTTHLWGRSSIGKTVALILCASCYGDPTKLIQSWNQREVATERRMAICNEVAIFLDELKQAIRKEDVERTLYAVANGHGRGRGSLKGQQKTLYWLLNLICTGEMPSTQSSTDEGGQARVLNIHDHLFGPGNKELVTWIEFTAKTNYGLAGSYFVQNANVENIKEGYKYYVNMISKMAKSDIASRIGDNLAVALAVGDQVNRVFGLTEENAGTLLKNLIEELLQDASTISRGTTALTQILEWSIANDGLFYPNTEFKKEIAGVWKESEYLAFFPYKLRSILEQFGFNYDAIIRDWAERNWIKCDKKHKNLQIRISPGKRCRMIVLEWEKIKNFL